MARLFRGGLPAVSMSVITQERKEKKETVGRSYGLRDHERMMVRLRRHIEKHGPLEHTRHESIDTELVLWSRYVRSHMGEIPDEWIARLQEAGFFNNRELKWLECLERLKHFKAGDGSARSRAKIAKACYSWAYLQRKKREKLEAYQIVLLDRTGFDWMLKARKRPVKSWEEQFERLLAYKERFGHCRVPRCWAEDCGLVSWVSRIRAEYKRGQMPRDLENRLRAVGFVWDIAEWRWEQQFAALKRYKKRFGHCRVPNTYKKNMPLALWVGNIRSRKDRLSPEQVARLDALGFHWDVFENLWERSFERLREGVEQNGGRILPKIWNSDRQMKTWVSEQRVNKRNGKLPEDRRKRLEAIGFTWEGEKATSWERQFAALEDFRKRFGHCRVPYDWPESPSLFSWVDTQREYCKKGILREDRRKRLERLGFIWDVYAWRWEQSYGELEAFKAENGHCRVPCKWKKNPSLGSWVRTQRLNRCKRTIGAERVARLDALGFDWEIDLEKEKEYTWEGQYTSLLVFKAVHGHCRVSKLHENDGPLRRWVAAVRRGDFKLTPGQRQALNLIGFVWKMADWQWDQKFAELEGFKERYGHCRVPAHWPENTSLARWVGCQRKRKRSEEIAMDQAARLQALGFEWIAPMAKPAVSARRAKIQEKRFTELLEYKERYGHCRVPVRWPENRILGLWVEKLRAKHKRGLLPEDQRKQLDGIGFVWDLAGWHWEQQFAALERYKKRFGHCRVTGSWKEDPGLATWVGNMRSRKKRLSPEQVARLDALGFEWRIVTKEISRDSWEERFAQLEAFKAEHGHCRVPNTYKKNMSLACWVGNMRSRKNRLSPEQVERLDALGFHWDVFGDLWERGFERLREGVRRNGGVFSPKVWKGDANLRSWVFLQKTKKQKGELLEDRQKRLEAIGFTWESEMATAWERRIAALEDFRKRFGHCRVPHGWPEDPSLFGWVDNQRQKHRTGILREDRRKQLEKLGFTWSVDAWRWEQSYGELEAFKAEHGHCRVPLNWKKSPNLGSWVRAQRLNRRKRTISAERVDRLDALGFEWGHAETLTVPR